MEERNDYPDPDPQEKEELREELEKSHPCVECTSISCKISKKMCTSRKRYNRFCKKNGIDYKTESIHLGVLHPWREE